VLYPPAAYRALFGVCSLLALVACACACCVTETGGATATPGDRRKALFCESCRKTCRSFVHGTLRLRLVRTLALHLESSTDC
jgi:hypothetical protein